MKKELSTTASVSVWVPIRDILRRYAVVLPTVVAAVMVGVGWGCSGDGVGIGTAMTEKIRGEGGGNNTIGNNNCTSGETCKQVTIGSQIWMAENLNIATSSGSWCYGNNPDNCKKYGRLYNWNTAMAGAKSSVDSNVRGVCPENWHLPLNDEWQTLVDTVGGYENAGTKLKSATGWNTYSGVPVGTDAYGFSALPGGYRNSVGSFNVVGNGGYWWTATGYSDGYACRRNMNYEYKDVYLGYSNKEYGFSVRCVRS